MRIQKLVEERLKATAYEGKALFERVGLSVDQGVVFNNSQLNQDAAFVILESEQSPEGATDTLSYRQQLEVTFVVVIAVRAINDRLGASVADRLNILILETRKALLGWAPAPYSEITLQSGELVSFVDGGAFWAETFTTDYIFEQE